MPTARILLRDSVHATIGFPALAERMGVHEKSVMRMPGPAGNPQAAHLLAALQALNNECGLTLKVHATPTRARLAGY